MTLGQIISLADIVKPNAFDSKTKTTWVNSIEGKVQTEVMLIPSEDTIQYDFDTDAGTELLVLPPHDLLYSTYLMAMIDFANGEFAKYRNSMELFNSQWGEFVRYYAKRYRPADMPPGFPRVFHIVRGSVAELEFTDLPTDDIADCRVYIQQGGNDVIVYTLAGGQCAVDGGRLTVSISQADSLKLAAGAARVTLIILDSDGNRYESYPAGRLKVEPTVEEGELTI